MDGENDSIFSDYCYESRDNEFTCQESDRDDDLAPKQKRAFVKMLAKFIRCAHSLNNPIPYVSHVLVTKEWHDLFPLKEFCSIFFLIEGILFYFFFFSM